MSGPEDTPTLANAGIPHFELALPVAITPMSAEAARAAVPLRPETSRAVAEQVDGFIEVLRQDEPQGASTRAEMARVSALGCDDIAHAAGLMQGRFLQHEVIEIEAGAACKAIADIRNQLAPLDPAAPIVANRPGWLLKFIAFGKPHEAHARKRESGAASLRQLLIRLRSAGHDARQAITDIEAARGELWEAMQKLAAAAEFAAAVGQRLPALAAGDPPRAPRVQAVLATMQGRLADILAQQAVCVNGYLVLDVLKKAGREMLNGCNRVAATTGAFVDEATRPGADTGSARLQELHDQACKAVDAMDLFRAKAKAVLRQNDSLIDRLVAEQRAARPR